jgi:hypothetical protein
MVKNIHNPHLKIVDLYDWEWKDIIDVHDDSRGKDSSAAGTDRKSASGYDNKGASAGREGDTEDDKDV